MLWNDEFAYNKSTGGVTYTDGTNTTVNVAATYLANGYTLTNGVLVAPTVNRVYTTGATQSVDFNGTNITVNEIDVTKTTTDVGTIVYVDQTSTVAATWLGAPSQQ